MASIGLQYELNLQKRLTAPPFVFCQNDNMNEKMNRLYSKLTTPENGSSNKNNHSHDNYESNHHNSNTSRSNNTRDCTEYNNNVTPKEGIFSRKVIPSLFIGTHGIMSSAAAYALGDGGTSQSVRKVREKIILGTDAAMILLDWEIPLSGDSNYCHKSSTQNITVPQSIDKPLILLLHGMNNDSSFGYIRSMMRTAIERGWIACCMNLRGQGGEGNNTPRGYNAGFTGDLRGVVQQLEYRLKRRVDGDRNNYFGNTSIKNNSDQSNYSKHDDDNDVDPYIGGPIFLIGYSLGANIITKYLGEESLHGTLPKCIGGGAALGNPLHIQSDHIKFPWNLVLAAGVKRSILQNYRSFKHFHDPNFQKALKKALLAPTLGKLDDVFAPYLLRNDPYPPYTPQWGYAGGGKEYWRDSSSHRYVAHVSGKPL